MLTIVILEVLKEEMNCRFLVRMKVAGQSKRLEQIAWTVKRESRTKGRRIMGEAGGRYVCGKEGSIMQARAGGEAAYDQTGELEQLVLSQVRV